MKGAFRRYGYSIDLKVKAILLYLRVHEQGIDDEKSYEINKLSQDLEGAGGYVEKIDQIITELEGFGMEVKFTATSENQGMPTTVSVNVNPATEQNRTRRHSISANEEQLKIIEQLWGQEITIGEFMEKVIPEVLEDTPEEIAEYLYATKMIWPDPFDPPQTGMTRAFKAAPESTDIQPKFIIVVHTDSDMDAEWPDIDFSSWSRVWLPHPWYRLPYMSVSSSLWYQDGSLKDFEFDDGSNVYKMEKLVVLILPTQQVIIV
ncbi:MAG: hypothetical protein OCU20_07690 [Methanophagales archaeon]|nr:hypothetical protein [Methanophagales archaeon]